MNKEMKRGDHIYVKTKFPWITHHGIYCGNGYAIHFDGHTKTIAKGSLKDFAKPFDINRIKIFKYPAWILPPGKWFAKRKASDDTIAVMKRAESLLGKSQYNLGKRNCEHFAVWCKTDAWYSPQIYYVISQLLRISIQASLALAAIPWPSNLVVGLSIGIFFGIPLLHSMSIGSKPPKA